jgi:hypothetical protein
MPQCEAIRPLDETWCHAPTDRQYQLGCIHEHIFLHYLCAEHAASVLICQQCWLADKHMCALFLKPDDKQLTSV